MFVVKFRGINELTQQEEFEFFVIESAVNTDNERVEILRSVWCLTLEQLEMQKKDIEERIDAIKNLK